MSVEHDKRVILYPAYINSKRTVSQGRRIPTDKACEDPHVMEMYDCCTKGLGLQADVEDKQYPRDWWLSRGRLRVALFKEDGSPANPDVPNRRELMIKVAELVPKHPNRHRKPGQSGAGGSGTTTPSTSGSSSKQTTSNKKKGKKK